MKSNQSLKNICTHCEKIMGQNKIACPFRSISNEYCEEYDVIKKDLEILYILKKYIYYSFKSNCIKMKYIYKHTTSFDYEILKEWLKNE